MPIIYRSQNKEEVETGKFGKWRKAQTEEDGANKWRTGSQDKWRTGSQNKWRTGSEDKWRTRIGQGANWKTQGFGWWTKGASHFLRDKRRTGSQDKWRTGSQDKWKKGCYLPFFVDKYCTKDFERIRDKIARLRLKESVKEVKTEDNSETSQKIYKQWTKA